MIISQLWNIKGNKDNKKYSAELVPCRGKCPAFIWNMNLKENTELQSGKYRIIRVLGQGGFGITYLAENVFFNKIVAIKEFFPKSFCGRDNTSHLTLGTTNNAETVEKLLNRFMKEAKNIAKLDHPGIVKIQDIFRENNTAYYVMDYIEGENLNELVKRNGPLSEEKAVEYIKKVGEALSYIHSKNMTHFDVKPANIMIRRSDDTPILIDFGLSKQYDNSGDATSTMLNAVSQGYSPIELYNPGSLDTFSPQTDVYSLAATLLFLLTGKTPPSASDIASDGLSLPDYIPNKMKESIEVAMNYKRRERPNDIGLLVDNLYKFHLSSHKRETPTPTPDEDTVIIGGEDTNFIHNLYGHEAVDLGLSVLWATKDIGSFEDIDHGEIYVWGDGDGKRTLQLKSSLLARWTKRAPQVNNIVGIPKYDTATGIWGNGWRMPTIKEVEELFDNCHWFGLGEHIKLFGPTGAGILLDSRKHWIGESPNGNLITYNWVIAQNKLGVLINQINKDWADSYFPIRPVIDKYHLK